MDIELEIGLVVAIVCRQADTESKKDKAKFFLSVRRLILDSGSSLFVKGKN